jgi:hypothetical protein
MEIFSLLRPNREKFKSLIRSFKSEMKSEKCKIRYVKCELFLTSHLEFVLLFRVLTD